MAGVDLDTSVLDPVIGGSKPPGRKSISFKFRLPRHGPEEHKESEDCMATQDSPPKYKDHWLIKVIERTLDSQGISYLNEELCQQWAPVDLKKRKKSVDADDHDKGPSKKKSKSGSKTKHSRISFKVTLKPPRDPSSSTAVETPQSASEPSKCLEAQAHGQATITPTSNTQSTQEIHVAANDSQMVSHSSQANLDAGCGTNTDRGVQCEGRDSYESASASRTLEGPSSSLESSLTHVHKCFGAIKYGQRKTSKVLFQEGSSLKSQADSKFDEDKTVSIEVMLMKLRASLKYLEASIDTGKKNRQYLLRRTGNLLFTYANNADKMVLNDFAKAYFRTLAKRLGVCAHMQYAQLAHKDDNKAMAIIRQAVEIAASTTKALGDLHQQADPLDPHITSAIVLAESILANCGLGPLEQHLYIAGKAMDEIEKAKL